MMIVARSLKSTDFGRGSPARLSLIPSLFPSSGGERTRQRPALAVQEVAVAELLADGLSGRDIGEVLQMSAGKVGSAITSLHFKLGVRTRPELSSALAELE